ncbi:pyridoxamine 5'-phosphate oxidase family protein [Methylobacter tundripaludum]|uniref:Pyridoxamine 5'-phosphate oxidase-related FMN-binding protein n=1 Tax=Methylobacter tundripaludum (strain ATCC BAA-1195 / DSM 17260 / SV96) TaxID=697282 RepID=G3IZC6_METTV|nr:pyridoxamine 5'-phosphate oxidase family protein [Methylobacter tundripaludum]EGW20298.1 pyridoxamine 5'-phosphate oxidase-related FMN-binding protein [Methylobacter tundripaludum SV96]
MSEFFHEGSRQLQDRFDTRPMADRLVDAIVSGQISPEDKAFIEEQNMFFFATVDREGRPNCSYKGGSVGLVKVIDEQTLAFPLYDGSGMYLSAGNVLVNEHVSLLFVDFQRQARLRLNGSAFIQDDDPLQNHWPEAELVLRVKVREMFPNCPRYIHKMTLVEESSFVPKQHCETPAPAWKRLEVVADVLPPRDAHLAGNEQDAAAALNRN